MAAPNGGRGQAPALLRLAILYYHSEEAARCVQTARRLPNQSFELRIELLRRPVGEDWYSVLTLVSNRSRRADDNTSQRAPYQHRVAQARSMLENVVWKDEERGSRPGRARQGATDATHVGTFGAAGRI